MVDDLDFKVNLGIIIHARFSDIQVLKDFLEEHLELKIVFQKIDKDRLRIVSGGDSYHQ